LGESVVILHRYPGWRDRVNLPVRADRDGDAFRLGDGRRLRQIGLSDPRTGCHATPASLQALLHPGRQVNPFDRQVSGHV
jgi:hypothetical protein